MAAVAAKRPERMLFVIEYLLKLQGSKNVYSFYIFTF